ncbi:MAG: hypothetical protein ACK5BP_05895 [Planctomyces sp.]
MNLPALLKQLSADRRTGTTATFTVADWTTSGIIFSSIQRSADKNLLLQSHFEPWPADFDPFASAQDTATFLRSLQQQHSWIGRPAAISVPRQLTAMRLLQVPIAAADDLAGAISLQLETRQQSAEPQQWDFLQHPDIAADTLYVTVLQMPARIAHVISEIAALAGWKKPVLTAADLFVGGASMTPGEFRISLQMNRSKLEVVVFRGGLPAASMATGTQFARDNDSMGSIALSLMQRVVETLPESWRSGSGEIPLAVSGSHAAPLARLLQSHGVTVLPGPFDERSPRAFALADSLYLPQRHCNLQQSRSAPPAFAIRHRLGIRLAATAACLLIIAVWLLWNRSTDLHRQLAQQQERLRAQQELISRGQPVLQQFERLSEWKQQSLHAADEIRNVALMVPDRDQMLLTRLQLENISDASERVLRVEGLARSPQVVQQLNTSILADAGHYALHPSGIGPAPAGSLLPVQFTIESQILQQSEDSATEENTADLTAEQEP